MNIFTIILGVFFLDVTISLFRQIYFYQLKEYRFDKIKGSFLYEGQFSKYFSVYRIYLYITVLLTFLLGSHYFIYSLFLSFLYNLNVSLRQGFLRPKFTFKAILITLFSLLSLSTLFLFNQSDFSMQIVYLALPFSVGIPILILKPITFLAKIYKVKKARKFLKKNHPNITVIGITGSYGKSSTKEFLSKLTQSLNSVTIPGNINTEIGVARFVLKKIPRDCKLLIVEMGAYTRKEILKIASITPPDIAIVTAVDKQHLSLFKSLKNIIRAKSEIIEGLKTSGTAFFCLDNPNIDKFLDYLHEKFPLDKRFLTVSKNQKSDFNYSYFSNNNIHNLAINDQNFKFKLHFEYLIPNLVLAILSAIKLEVSNKDIQKALDSIDTCKLNIDIYENSKNQTVLNDSYNSNLKGFTHVIDFAKKHKAPKKILINSGLKELGAETKLIQSELYKKAAKVFDEIYLTDKHLKKFIPKEYKSKFHFLLQSKSLIQMIEKIPKESLIVVEGRTFSNVIPFLKK